MPSTTQQPSVPSQVTPSVWWVEGGRRLRTHFFLKTLGICAFMTVFFSAYFYLLRHPAGAVTVMPLTALDHAIPFTPAALLAYVSLWVYVGIPAGMAESLRDAVRYGLWAGVLCLVGLLCFYVYPTAVPAAHLGTDSTFPGFALLQGVDASGNACPSLHVATAVFSAFFVDHQLRGLNAPAVMRAASAAWMLLIVWSTLAVKQHVVLDVVFGLLLGCVFGLLALHRRTVP